MPAASPGWCPTPGLSSLPSALTTGQAWALGCAGLGVLVLGCGAAIDGTRRRRAGSRSGRHAAGTGCRSYRDAAWWVALAFIPSTLAARRHQLHHHGPRGDSPLLDGAAGPLPGHVHPGVCPRTQRTTRLRPPCFPGGRPPRHGPGGRAGSPILDPASPGGLLRRGAGLPRAACDPAAPGPAREAFYLALAVGGVLGGAFNTLAAPMIFDRLVEYPLAVFLACLVSPGVAGPADAPGLNGRLSDVTLPGSWPGSPPSWSSARVSSATRCSGCSVS